MQLSFKANSKLYTLTFLRWLALSAVTGGVCGLVGAAFAHGVNFVTDLRADNSWLLYLLPVAGLLTAVIYRLFKVTDTGTNQVLESVRTEKKVPVLLAPAVFLCACLTHLCGGSSGREGAALQIGGGITSIIGKGFKLDENARHILTMCGMGALFSAVFGTPLGACVFALEVISVGKLCLAAVFPTLMSSITAYLTATALGVVPERFHMAEVSDITFDILWRVLVIAIAGAVISWLFCQALHLGEKIFRCMTGHHWLRIVIGGAVIVVLTVIAGTEDYNGSGIAVIHRIFSGGSAGHEAFLLKIIFTVITVAAGFKGGEIIPSYFIGATLGNSLAILLGMEPTLGAAVGMTALFCGVTNCPLAAVFLSAEMFGADSILFFALSSVIGYLLSGKTGLYDIEKSRGHNRRAAGQSAPAGDTAGNT